MWPRHGMTTGYSSNTARAIILIEDELLTSRSFILGRVMLGNCEASISLKQVAMSACQASRECD